MKTFELTGPVLDWAVAKCEGKYLIYFSTHFRTMSHCSGHSSTRTEQLLSFQPLKDKWCILVGNGLAQEIPEYSTNWPQGGPIIDREGIALRRHSSGTWYAKLSSDLGDSRSADWSQQKPGERYGPLSYQVARVGAMFSGPTPLIAAMRCYVASKLGDEIEVPEELCLK